MSSGCWELRGFMGGCKLLEVQSWFMRGPVAAEKFISHVPSALNPRGYYYLCPHGAGFWPGTNAAIRCNQNSQQNDLWHRKVQRNGHPSRNTKSGKQKTRIARHKHRWQLPFMSPSFCFMWCLCCETCCNSNFVVSIFTSIQLIHAWWKSLQVWGWNDSSRLLLTALCGSQTCQFADAMGGI